MTRHATRTAGAVVVLVLSVSACGGSVRTGAAATLGSDRITDTVLQQTVDRGLADPQSQQQAGADKPAYVRSVLSRLLTHRVIDQAAKDQGVSVTPSQVDDAQDRIAEQLGGAAGLQAEAVKAGIAPSDLRQSISDVALRDALADKLTAGVSVPQAELQAAYQASPDYDQVRSAHILVATEAAARQLLAQVTAHPENFGALAMRFSTDTGSKDKGGELGFQGRGALAKEFEAAIFGAKPGSFVLAHTQFGYHVIHVEERKTVPLAEALPTLRRAALSQQRSQAVQALLTTTANRLHIRVNPRFGRWDVTKLDVEPGTTTAPFSKPSPTAGAVDPLAPPAQ